VRVSQSRRIVSLLSALAFFAASLLLWALLPSIYQPARSFAPYVTVATEMTHDDAAERLTAAGAEQIITPATTYVLLSRIGRVDEVPLSAVDELLDPVDPRRDPFMKELSAYFRIGGQNALYVEAPGSLLDARRLVNNALGPGARVAELDLAARWASAAFPLLAALAALAYSLRSGGVRFISFLPFFLPSFFFGIGAGVSAALMALAIDWLLLVMDAPRRVMDRELATALFAQRRRLFWVALVVLAGLLNAFVLHGPQALLALLLAIAGCLSVRAAAAILARPAVRDEEHRAFRPVPILVKPRFRSTNSRERLVAVVAVAGILVLAPLIDRVLTTRSVDRPVPHAEQSGPVSFETLRNVAASRVSGSLPDLSDYLAHRAYQESFAYGGTYQFPDPDQPVMLERFRLGEDGAFTSFSEPVLQFDDQWLQAALTDPPPGIVSLLATRDYPSGVALSGREALYSRYSRIALHVLFLTLTLLPFAVGSPHRVRLKGRTGAITTGRSRQVA